MDYKKLKDTDFMRLMQSTLLEEKKKTVESIRQLMEAKSRRVHVTFGCRSLFEFCVQKLGMSEGSVMRRMQIAKVASEVPEILTAIENRKISLTVASMIAPKIRPDNVKKWLLEYSGLSKRQAEEKLARNNPVKKKPELIKPIGFALVSEEDLTKTTKTNCSDTNQSPKKSPHTVVKREERFSFAFSGNKDLRDKVLRAKGVMANKLKSTAMEDVMDAALDALLDKHDPLKKAERLKKKDEVKPLPPYSNSRKVPKPMERALLRLAKGRCEAMTLGGRCRATHNLHIDHIIPWAKGGKTEMSNLQVLCGNHNLAKARADFGPRFIDKKIEENRRSSPGVSRLPLWTDPAVPTSVRRKLILSE